MPENVRPAPLSNEKRRFSSRSVPPLNLLVRASVFPKPVPTSRSDAPARELGKDLSGIFGG
jgi:hypothetical protein